MTKDTTEEQLRERHAKFASGQAERSVVVPVGRAIAARQHVLTHEQAADILRAADLIAVTACDCRASARRCDAPVDVCIVVGDMARSAAGNPVYRPVGVEEALAILDRTSALGLVHLSLWYPGHVAQAVCSCCTCCCSELRAIAEFGYDDFVVRSDFIAALHPEGCDGCGVCAGRCRFGAITMGDHVARHDPSRCFGCGLCAMTCPTGALTLSERR